jgi:hypothetical protein
MLFLPHKEMRAPSEKPLVYSGFSVGAQRQTTGGGRLHKR